MLWRTSTYLEWYWSTILYVTDSRMNLSLNKDKYNIKFKSWQVCQQKFQQKIKTKQYQKQHNRCQFNFEHDTGLFRAPIFETLTITYSKTRSEAGHIQLIIYYC